MHKWQQQISFPCFCFSHVHKVDCPTSIGNKRKQPVPMEQHVTCPHTVSTDSDWSESYLSHESEKQISLEATSNIMNLQHQSVHVWTCHFWMWHESVCKWKVTFKWLAASQKQIKKVQRPPIFSHTLISSRLIRMTSEELKGCLLILNSLATYILIAASQMGSFSIFVLTHRGKNIYGIKTLWSLYCTVHSPQSKFTLVVLYCASWKTYDSYSMHELNFTRPQWSICRHSLDALKLRPDEYMWYHLLYGKKISHIHVTYVHCY